MGHATIRDQVLKKITDKVGQVVYAEDIAKDLNLTREQVAAALNSMIRTGSLENDMQVVSAGRAWRYSPGSPQASSSKRRGTRPTDRRLFEEIGPSKQGIIVQDEDGKLYLLEEL